MVRDKISIHLEAGFLYDEFYNLSYKIMACLIPETSFQYLLNYIF